MGTAEKETGYNGYTNYETWNVALWMDNDPGEHEAMRDLAREAKANPIENQYMAEDRRIVSTLQDSLKAYYEEQAESWMPGQASCFADLFNSALGQVNWYEIAEILLEELADENEDENDH